MTQIPPPALLKPAPKLAVLGSWTVQPELLVALLAQFPFPTVPVMDPEEGLSVHPVDVWRAIWLFVC